MPAEDDRLDFDRVDRPLRGVSFDSAGDLPGRAAVTSATTWPGVRTPDYSADLGAFGALLTSFGQLSKVVASGQLTPRSRIEDFDGWWFGFFSFLASGPPAHRLRELLALSQAGIVEFLGADMWIDADDVEGRWRAGSASSPHVVGAGALIEARLPRPSVGHTRERSPPEPARFG